MSMRQVLIAVDKFKGCLTAADVAQALATGLSAGHGPHQVSCHTLPLADGGDGSVQAALDAGFSPLTTDIEGPTGQPARTTIAFDGSTAVIEVATTCGLQMLPAGHREPLASSSAGLGQALRTVLEHQPRRIVLALGGSATTDGGAGMLAALGVRFLDAAGVPFIPTGGTLQDIARIDPAGLVPLTGVELIAANDVQNPLIGPRGAAAVYGPQKGASPQDVDVLEAGLVNLARRLDEAGWPGTSSAATPGAGSAGGLGFAALLLGARMVSGADFFLDLLGFDHALEGCDLVITGEGKLDEQTLSGKLPLVVARRAAPVPIIAVVGHNALEVDQLPDHHIERVYALSAMTTQDSAQDPVLSARLLTEIGQAIYHSPTLGKDTIRS
ncbi:glycerate kinase [Citricoccus nitrophenolicus]